MADSKRRFNIKVRKCKLVVTFVVVARMCIMMCMNNLFVSPRLMYTTDRYDCISQCQHNINISFLMIFSCSIATSTIRWL